MNTVTIKTDLRNQFGSARDQGCRPTCLAFAASDCHAGRRSGWVELSCEYLYYESQRRSGKPPNCGSTLTSVLKSLNLSGQPTEADWPYMQQLPSDISTWTPPSSIGQRFSRFVFSITDI